MDLVRYNRARKALAAAVSVDEVKDIRDKAMALKAYAQQAQDHQLEIDASEIRIRAERRLGVMIKAQKDTVGLAPPGPAPRSVPQENRTPTLADVGISKKLSARSQAIAEIPEEEFEATLSEHREEQEAVTGRTMEKLAKRRKRAATAEGRCAVAEEVEAPIMDAAPQSAIAPGWHDVGRHRLFCGCSASDDFRVEARGAKLVFADPPYNASAAVWDEGFEWAHDYLADAGDIVIVTPGISAIPAFFNATAMPYKWSIACHITNGMTRGAMGFGNWIYAAVFSRGSVYTQTQDHIAVSIGGHPGTEHKGRKPAQFIAWLIDTFTKPGDVIVDPFLGSGTTLFVAEKMGRVCMAAEIVPEYCGEIVSKFNSIGDAENETIAP